MKKFNFWTISLLVIYGGLFISAWNEYNDINRKLRIDMASDVYEKKRDLSGIKSPSKLIDCMADGAAAHLKEEVGFLNYSFGYIVRAMTGGYVRLPGYRKFSTFDIDVMGNEGSYIILKCVDEYRATN